MPLLGNGEYREPLALGEGTRDPKAPGARTIPQRKQSQHSATARIAMNNISAPGGDGVRPSEEANTLKKEVDQKLATLQDSESNLAAHFEQVRAMPSDGVALTDTPLTTAPNSPTM